LTRPLAWLAAGLVLAAAPAHAQFNALTQIGGKEPISKDQPVTFTADAVEYDRDAGIVTATGHVEAWQNDNILRADKVTFDRNTNVAAATGNVVVLQPDGQVLFADYAELTAGMKDGILRGMRAQLAENGKLAANGARRTNGLINELSKVVYSTCNICKDDPSQPPFWQMRASSAVEDKEHERIEFTDATLEMFGYPVAYFPYFSNADPSAKRQSGFLIPSVGNSSFVGTFLSAPYYVVLDDQSDVTITPTVTSRDGPQLDLDYRRRFNDGELSLNGSVGYLNRARCSPRAASTTIRTGATASTSTGRRRSTTWRRSASAATWARCRPCSPAAPSSRASGKAPTPSSTAGSTRASRRACPTPSCRSCCRASSTATSARSTRWAAGCRWTGARSTSSAASA
jgi:LPS-assembly protein